MCSLRPATQRQSPFVASEPYQCVAMPVGRLRRKQMLGVQFYRQKPVGNYIADFYAPAARLVVEVDGSQHFEPRKPNTTSAAMRT